jgi:RNA polymerase sigma factor (sigma-70 family)
MLDANALAIGGSNVPASIPLTQWLRAAGDGDRDAGERAYALVYAELRRLAARAMRQTVVDHARERLAQKRGGGLLRTQIDDDGITDSALDAQQALAIDQALHALDAQDGELAETFSWRVFAGLTTPQIAQLRGVTERTVQRDITLARNYLRRALGNA